MRTGAAAAEAGAVEVIPARGGVGRRLRVGQTIAVINTHGDQVVDTWAFAAPASSEHLSMEHSRASLLRLVPKVGDTLLSNRRAPMLTMMEDTSGGAHDMLIAACDARRYAQLGVMGYHDSCADNLARALADLGLPAAATPCPLNLFMRVPIAPDGSLSFAAPAGPREGYVALRAEMDLFVIFSACPQDVTPVNGMRPTEAHFRIF